MAKLENETLMVNQIITRRKDKMDQKYYDIVLTDARVHVTNARNPKSLGRMIAKSVRSVKPGRAHTNNLKSTSGRKLECILEFGKEFEKLEEQAKKEGKEIRIFVPKNGLPIFPGNDTIEYIKAHYKTE